MFQHAVLPEGGDLKPAVVESFPSERSSDKIEVRWNLMVTCDCLQKLGELGIQHVDIKPLRE